MASELSVALTPTTYGATINYDDERHKSDVAPPSPRHLNSDASHTDTRVTDYLFKFLLLTQVWMYLEAGAIPSLLEQFTRTFHLNPEEQGLLGAVVYIAISFASPWCSMLYRRFCPRSVLGISLVVNNLAVFFMAIVPTLRWYSKPLLILLRGVVGLTQAFHVVYAPLWVHEYAPRDKRGMWMSFLQASTPFGITLGYFAGSVTVWASSVSADAPSTAADMPLMDMDNVTIAIKDALESTLNANLLGDVGTPESALCHGIFCWRWPFLMQFLLVLPLSVLIFFVPRAHITIQQSSHSMVVMDDETDSTGDDSAKNDQDQDIASEVTRLLQEPSPNTRRRELQQQEAHMWENLLELFQYKVFVCIVLGLSALFFVVSGIQFWTTLYLSTNTEDSLYKIHTAYLIVSGTGPILGVFFGGWLIDQAGGYSGPHQQPKALRLCMVVGLVSCLCSIPVAFAHTTDVIALFLWLMLFFGGALLPACSGIVISSAPRRLRPLASSVAYTSYNLLGYASSNYLPGLIMNLIVRHRGDGPDACNVACTYRVGFRIVLFWTGCAFACLVAGAYFSEQKRIEAEEEERLTGRRATSHSIA